MNKTDIIREREREREREGERERERIYCFKLFYLIKHCMFYSHINREKSYSQHKFDAI